MDNDLRISSAAVSDRGLSEKRPENEDSLLEMPLVGIFAVADGVGGAQAGEVASQMAVEILGEAFSNLPASSDAETAMRAAMEKANSAIFQMAHELPQLSSMATTIVALHVNGEIATIGHVGDSRVYRVDPQGNLFRETDDHSVVAEEVRAGRMTEEQADNHPSKNVISRALGAEGTVEPDLKTIMVESGTSFLLCSDGITRHVSDAEIKSALTFGGDPTDICEYLKNLVYERGAEDNLTAVVLRVGAAVARERDSATEEMPSLDTLENEEEPTIAAARVASRFDSTADDDEDVLELDTGDLPKPLVGNETIKHEEPEPPEAEQDQTIQIESPQTAASAASSDISIFGSSSGQQAPAPLSSGIGGIGNLIVGLILGGAIGFGVYYFVLAQKPAEQPQAGLSEMKADNISFSTFEKLRRTVDKDPAAFVKEVPPAEDAEDFYLLGRAYLLTGDIPNARFSLLEARRRIAKTNETNAKILVNDIALALVIANDPEAQKRLQSEIEAARAPANANANWKASPQP